MPIRLPMLSLAMLIVVIASIQAQPPEFGRGGGGRMRVSPVVAAIDANGDGIISAAEMEKSQFALKSLDKNKDGQLTEDEIRPEFGGPGGPGGRDQDHEEHGGSPRVEATESVVTRLMALDKDGDGKLNEKELTGRLQSILVKADTNKDGFATKVELEAMAAADAKASAAASGGREGGRGGREGAGGPPNPAEAVNRAMVYDVDKDGKLNSEELAKMFSEMGQGRGGPGGRQEIRRPE